MLIIKIQWWQRIALDYNLPVYVWPVADVYSIHQCMHNLSAHYLDACSVYWRLFYWCFLDLSVSDRSIDVCSIYRCLQDFIRGVGGDHYRDTGHGGGAENSGKSYITSWTGRFHPGILHHIHESCKSEFCSYFSSISCQCTQQEWVL